jgi:peptide/nickel transport system ATP-binding protein
MSAAAAQPGRTPVVKIKGLDVGFAGPDGIRSVVRQSSFEINAGECLAIVGESGSGKSVTARALIGLAGDGSTVTADLAELDGESFLGYTDRKWRTVRGSRVGFVLQDALVSLDPLRPVGREIDEALKLHGAGDASSRSKRVIELLQSVSVPEPAVRARQLPGELSGGLRQRALIASAIALDPPFLIADEPTTALDVTVQAQILNLLADMKANGTALLLISHDLSVVGRLADRIAVMNHGEIVEQGTADQVLGSPANDYTRTLLDAVPSTHNKRVRLAPRQNHNEVALPVDRAPGADIVVARDLVKRYLGPDKRHRTVVNDVSLTLREGETVGVVGESGSGKTTVARLILGLERPDGGTVTLSGQDWSAVPERTRRPLRRLISAVYQDPLSSFDPRWTVSKLLQDAIPREEYRTRSARTARARELLEMVGLDEEFIDRKPLLLSGGQRQRVAIARALASNPRVIVCDEAVSALDVSVQAQVLDLLADLQDKLRLSYVFISHDLGVIHHVSDRILVMQHGRVVEEGAADQIFADPQEAYTRELLSALPTLERPATASAG